MTAKSFTFFEIHLHDGLSFSATNTAPAIGGSSSESDGDSSSEDGDPSGGIDDAESTDEERGGPFSGGSTDLPIGGLIALVLLVALAAVAKYLRSGGEADALSELDDVDEE